MISDKPAAAADLTAERERRAAKYAEHCVFEMGEEEPPLLDGDSIALRFKDAMIKFAAQEVSLAATQASPVTQKQEEIILKAVNACNPTSDGERFCLYNIIEAAIKSAVAQAVAEEREACAKAICPVCSVGHKPEESRPGEWWHTLNRCPAEAIYNRERKGR